MSAALVAFAALVQALATVVLVAVTVRYVRVTQAQLDELRKSSDAAERMQQLQAALDRQELLALVGSLSAALESFPHGDQVNEALVSQAERWSAEDEQRLIELTRIVLPDRTANAHEAKSALTYLRLLQKGCGVSLTVEFRRSFGGIRTEGYGERREFAIREIGLLEFELRHGTRPAA